MSRHSYFKITLAVFWQYCFVVILKNARKSQESSGSTRLQVPQHQRHGLQYPAALPLEAQLYPAIVIAHFPQDVDSKEV